MRFITKPAEIEEHIKRHGKKHDADKKKLTDKME